MRPSHYTASTLLNVTNLRLSSSDQDTFYAEALFDPTFLETQIQIIGSAPIARAVIASENLADANSPQADIAARALGAGLEVTRVGQSNLVEVAFTDPSAERAARIANAVALAYIEKLGEDRESAVQSASSWLRDRLRGVGAQAQVVSAAVTPIDKSDMRGALIIVAAGIVGAVGGMTLALILGFVDRRVRDPEQVHLASGAECLGIVPRLKTRRTSKTTANPDGQFSFRNGPDLLSEVERRPFTALGQALRSAGVVAFSSRSSARPQTIAVTSTFAGEGKTTIAANLAQAAASSGKRVLLVDAQPYDPALSSMLAPAAVRGLVEFLADDAPSLASHILVDSQSRVHFLPFGAARNRGTGAQLVWSDRMEKLLQQARSYDLIVFDVPPLAATGDLRAAASFIDNFLLVVQWNTVPADELQAALSMVAPVRDRLVGTILNKAALGPVQRWFSPEAAIVARQSGFTQKPLHGSAR